MVGFGIFGGGARRTDTCRASSIIVLRSILRACVGWKVDAGSVRPDMTVEAKEVNVVLLLVLEISRNECMPTCGVMIGKLRSTKREIGVPKTETGKSRRKNEGTDTHPVQCIARERNTKQDVRRHNSLYGSRSHERPSRLGFSSRQQRHTQ